MWAAMWISRGEITPFIWAVVATQMTFFIFTPKIGEDEPQFDKHIFQMGLKLNHQLEYGLLTSCYPCILAIHTGILHFETTRDVSGPILPPGTRRTPWVPEAMLFASFDSFTRRACWSWLTAPAVNERRTQKPKTIKTPFSRWGLVRRNTKRLMVPCR